MPIAASVLLCLAAPALAQESGDAQPAPTPVTPSPAIPSDFSLPPGDNATPRQRIEPEQVVPIMQERAPAQTTNREVEQALPTQAAEPQPTTAPQQPGFGAPPPRSDLAPAQPPPPAGIPDTDAGATDVPAIPAAPSTSSSAQTASASDASEPGAGLWWTLAGLLLSAFAIAGIVIFLRRQRFESVGNKIEPHVPVAPPAAEPTADPQSEKPPASPAAPQLAQPKPAPVATKPASDGLVQSRIPAGNGLVQTRPFRKPEPRTRAVPRPARVTAQISFDQ